MSDRESLPELSPRLRALVDDERQTLDHDPARLRAVLLGVERVVATKANAASSATDAEAMPKGAATTSFVKAAGLAGAIFAAGVGVGAGAATYHAASSRSPTTTMTTGATPVPVTESAPPVPVTESAPPVPVTESAPPSSPPAPSSLADEASGTARPTRSSATSGASATSAATSDLSHEQAIIDAARAGLASGHPEVALEAIARHERLFPRGQLTEERDGMRVLALARAGRRGEARARAEQFRRTHPTSALLPRIDEALR